MVVTTRIWPLSQRLQHTLHLATMSPRYLLVLLDYTMRCLFGDEIVSVAVRHCAKVCHPHVGVYIM